MAEPVAKKKKLDHKNVLITGGSNGIGAAIALDWGVAGNRVFITGREETACSAVCQKIQAAGGSASFSLGDVSVLADVERVCAEAAAFFGEEGISVLVANAGCGGGRQPVEDCSVELFDKQFATNVRGVFLFIRQVLPGMKRQRSGQIVVTSSVAGVLAVPNGSVYAASKWAVEGLVRSVRAELKGTGVKIGTINPAAVATKWWDEEGRGGTRIAGSTPTAFLEAEDCAAAARTIIGQAATSDIGSVILEPPAPLAKV